MQLGLVGLGRMGSGMTERLRQGGHEVMTYDPAVDSTAESLEELKEQLEPPRVTWLMVPSGDITEQTFQQVLGLADDGDTIVDGGNSYFRHSMRRHEETRTLMPSRSPSSPRYAPQRQAAMKVRTPQEAGLRPMPPSSKTTSGRM